MDKKRAFKAGCAAALASSAVLVLARAARITLFNPELLLGSFVTQSAAPSSWLFGLFLHVMLGGLAALFYAAGFERLAAARPWKWGMAFGYLHALVSGILLLGLVPHVHPLVDGSSMSGVLRDPGPFAVRFGILTAFLFMGLHLAYGAAVGALYGASSRKAFAHPVGRFEIPDERSAA